MEDFKLSTEQFGTGIIAPPQSWIRSEEIIKVIGVGGGGCNAVSYMYSQGVEGCSFVVCNTDRSSLEGSHVPVKIQLGEGLGAGTNPVKGRNAAIDAKDKIEEYVLSDKTKMLFITAGMGGGTGTGASPVIAKMAKDKGILTVAVVTLPFESEGSNALTKAVDGIHELEKNVDSLILINNEKLYDCYGDLLIHEAYPKADEVLATAVKGIVEIIQKPGFVNVDFADVTAVMRGGGMALMGHGIGRGEKRIETAVREALSSPLLNDAELHTAKNLLINITCSKNEHGLKMADLKEVDKEIAKYTDGKVNNFKRGLVYGEDNDDTVHITVIATGFKVADISRTQVESGNLINIGPGFTYEKYLNDANESEEGISLGTVEGEPYITLGYNTDDNKRHFNFDRDDKPCLCIEEGESIAALENVTALHRNHKLSK